MQLHRQSPLVTHALTVLSRESSFTRDKMGVKPSTLAAHQQCVRRCIFDHNWIIFHLITCSWSFTTRYMRGGIKSNPTPLRCWPYEKQISLPTLTKPWWTVPKSNGWKFRRWMIENRSMGKSMTEGVRRNCVKKLWKKSSFTAACLPRAVAVRRLLGGNRTVICGRWWFLWPPRNPRK